MCARKLSFQLAKKAANKFFNFVYEIFFRFRLIDAERFFSWEKIFKYMNEDKFNTEKIEAYLLGALPDEEAERFDELGFTDDDFADALSASEADLIDRYVNNDLRDATLERFEKVYLATPKRREKVEFARQLKAFAEREIGAPRKDFAAETEESKSGLSKFFASLNIFKNQNSFLQFGFAAATILVLILGGLWFLTTRSNQTQIARQDAPANFEPPVNQPRVEENTQIGAVNQTTNSNAENKIPATNVNANSSANRAENANKKTVLEPTPTPKPKETVAPSKPIVASFLLLPSLRGNNRIQSLSVAEKITDVAIQLKLEADDYPAYRVNLIDPSSGKILRRGDVIKSKSKGADKQLNVGFPAKLLKSRIYTLQISGVSADGESEIISDYPFRVVR